MGESYVPVVFILYFNLPFYCARQTQNAEVSQWHMGHVCIKHQGTQDLRIELRTEDVVTAVNKLKCIHFVRHTSPMH
jgi:hypothetical protein